MWRRASEALLERKLGVGDGGLSPCPASNNCVSSRSTEKIHAVAPLAYTTSTSRAIEDLKTIILGMKRSRIITEARNYIHAEFRSAIWGFVDDAEFFFDENAKVVHVRSAARLGAYDFGVNRKRVEVIRAQWRNEARSPDAKVFQKL